MLYLMGDWILHWLVYRNLPCGDLLEMLIANICNVLLDANVPFSFYITFV